MSTTMLGSVFNRHQASSSEKSRAKLRIMRIGKESYPFSEFRGLGSPGLNLGQPGDIYIDITPGFHALYARYPESWLLWPGSNDASNILRHPLRSDRCLWCNTKVGWIHPRHVRVNPANASELLSETLKFEEKLLEESKKRKRESLHQPTGTELPSSTTNTSSPSRNRNSVENQIHQPTRTDWKLPSSTFNTSSPGRNRNSVENQIHQPIHTDWKLPSSTTNTSSPSRSCNSVEKQTYQSPDSLTFLSSPTPYSHTPHEIMNFRTLTPTDASITQNSDCTRSPNTAHQCSIPTVKNHMFTSDNLNELSTRNSQDLYTSSKRIDLRKVTFGEAKLRPFTMSSKRRVSLPTHTRPVSYPANEEQSLPQPSQPSIHDTPETLRIFRNDDSPLGSAQANSAAMFREPFVNNTALQISPDKPFSFDPSDITGASFVTNLLYYSASVASTNLSLPSEATPRSHINNGLSLDIAITELRKVKNTSDANAAQLQEANDKIHLLEEENAKLRAQLNQCRNNSLSSDIPLTITDVEMPPAVNSHALIGTTDSTEELIQSITGAREIVKHRLSPRHSPYDELESSLAPEHSATPSASLLLPDTSMITETTFSVDALPSTKPETEECRNTIDILNVKADTSSHDGCNSFESTCSPLKDVDSWHASPIPTSTSPRMREIHRSVLFANAGSLLICRICLGTKMGGIETVDQAFQTSEDSPELLQEHCEKEHPIDCEAVLKMSDEDLVDVVSMLSSEC